MPAWDDYRTGARHDGLVPALTLLVRTLSPGTVPRGAGGHAVVPRAVLDELGERTPSVSPALLGLPATYERELTVLLPANDADLDGGGDRTAGTSEDWRTGLVWLRLGSSEALRDATVAHLGGRTADGGTLLMKQMVKGTLADVLTEHLEIVGVLRQLAYDGDSVSTAQLGPQHTTGGRDEVLDVLQQRVTRADRTLLRLLGAHGYTADGPGATAGLSELLADIHRARAATTEGAEGAR